MTRGSAPRTGTSRAHSSGTALSPILRAATAGNSASRSSVSVKMQETRSSAARWLRPRISRISSSVAPRMASASFSVIEVAPRRAYRRIGGGIQSAAQPLDLRGGELAVPAGRQAAEPERAEGHPLERLDAVPDRLAHPPHLALATLVDGDLELARGDATDLRRRGAAVVELDALAELAQRRLVHRRAADDGAVGLGHLERRVGEAVGELPVVGEQDQAGAVGVEAADRIEAAVGLDEVDDRLAAVRVAGGRDDSLRLVEDVDGA